MLTKPALPHRSMTEQQARAQQAHNSRIGLIASIVGTLLAALSSYLLYAYLTHERQPAYNDIITSVQQNKDIILEAMRHENDDLFETMRQNQQHVLDAIVRGINKILDESRELRDELMDEGRRCAAEKVVEKKRRRRK